MRDVFISGGPIGPAFDFETSNNSANLGSRNYMIRDMEISTVGGYCGRNRECLRE